MQSRMEKYYQDSNNQISRTEKHINSYKELYGSNLDSYDVLPVSSNVNVIDADTLKKLATRDEYKRQKQNKEEDDFWSDNIPKGFEENKIYDINELIKKAREQKNSIVKDVGKLTNYSYLAKLEDKSSKDTIEEEIKKETIAKRVHYSTKIEGNSLDLNTVKKIIENTNNSHERNVLEVRNYYNALMYLNKEADTNNSITEDLIFKVHNLIIGKNLNAKATYRDGQNIVEDSLTKQIVYMPPEAKDIKALINQMIKEFDNKTSKDIPIPIKAGIIEYEFVTIHPFWDGNGRTSRLLANYILKAYGYDLKGFYVME